MLANCPNPFITTTEIYFSIPADGSVELSIFNLTGRRVITLVDENPGIGLQSTIWNGRDSCDRPVSSGIYFYVLRNGGQTITNRMTLIH
ncbi:MAG: T9SS type A sorting domain-containing protein [Candidatus Sabulitectum sp.]|nr:T9SS type A sorting domain-containing protein [Candidatus Sabulitectum sp.]